MTPGTGDTRQHCEHECVCSPYRVIFGKTFGKDDESCVRKNCKHDTRRSRPVAASQPTPGPKFNSADLLLLAHDEWKRREERKHRHENAPWCAGFINGFLTDKKWAREMVDKIQKDAEDKHRSKAGAP